jgi:hypothetical protein
MCRYLLTSLIAFSVWDTAGVFCSFYCVIHPLIVSCSGLWLTN